MTKENYDYLLKYRLDSAKEHPKCKNWFYPVEESDILSAEKELGFRLPNQIRKFYQIIGYGSIKEPLIITKDFEFFEANYICPPSIILQILAMGIESGYITEESLSCMQTGDLPFFQISDSSGYLVLRPKSEKPNSVWTDTGVLIEREFKDFIWNLFYIGPLYYLRNINNHHGKINLLNIE